MGISCNYLNLRSAMFWFIVGCPLTFEETSASLHIPKQTSDGAHLLIHFWISGRPWEGSPFEPRTQSSDPSSAPQTQKALETPLRRDRHRRTASGRRWLGAMQKSMEHGASIGELARWMGGWNPKAPTHPWCRGCTTPTKCPH